MGSMVWVPVTHGVEELHAEDFGQREVLAEKPAAEATGMHTSIRCRTGAEGSAGKSGD